MKGAGFPRGKRGKMKLYSNKNSPGPASYNVFYSPKSRRGACAVIGNASKVIE